MHLSREICIKSAALYALRKRIACKAALRQYCINPPGPRSLWDPEARTRGEEQLRFLAGFICLWKIFSFVFRSRAARFPNVDDSLGRPFSTRQALHVLLLSCRREGRLCVLVDLELKEAVPGAAAAAVGWTCHGAWDLLTEREKERDKKDSWKTARVKGGLAGSVNTLKPFIYFMCECVRARVCLTGVPAQGIIRFKGYVIGNSFAVISDLYCWSLLLVKCYWDA